MNRRRRTTLAVSGAVLMAGPALAQEADPLVLAGDRFDVTGAGTLEPGDVDAVLQPFHDPARNLYLGTINLELVVDRAGAVTECSNADGTPLAEAALALCDHLRAKGRFTLDPLLVLDFTRATYRVSFGTRYNPQSGDPTFRVFDTAYPLERVHVLFGSDAIPPEDQRLTLADLHYEPMDYPRSALRSEIRAGVVVDLRFDAEGKVASCRPLESSNTARMAYETCKAAAGSFRLKNAPDARAFVLSINWNIP